MKVNFYTGDVVYFKPERTVFSVQGMFSANGEMLYTLTGLHIPARTDELTLIFAGNERRKLLEWFE